MKKLFNRLETSQTADAAVISAAVFVFILAAGIFFMTDNRHVCFELSGGRELTVEYGQGFTDPGASAAAVGTFTLSRPLKVARQGSVDTAQLGTYTLTYKAHYKSRDYTTQRTVNVVDTTPPKITLRYDSDYRPSWLDGYSEEGYSATDAHDGDLTDKVCVTREDGRIIYSVEDAAGNRAQLERKPNYSTGRPVLTLLGEENVTISARPRYQDPGCSAYDEQGNDMSAYIAVSGAFQPDTPGEYTLCYSVENADGDRVSAVRHIRVAGETPGEEVRSDEKVIYLTFDDGPSAYTEGLLDVLGQYNAKATFFVTGNREKYRGAISRAYSEGHSVGVHSYTHDYGSIYSSEDAFFDDFNRAQDMIYDLTGSYTQLYRFPGGSSNTVSRFNRGIVTRLAEELGRLQYRYFDWNVYSGDAGETQSRERVAQNIISGCEGKSCAVVLQHDTKSFSVDAVEEVLQWGIANGYSFKALDLNSPGAHHAIAN